MVLPTNSTAKSAFPGVALKALAQEYGAGTPDLLISTYTPETAAAAGDWNSVTFGNTLDMATGNYDSAVFPADENGARMNDFFLALSDAAKTSLALQFPNQARAGTQFVYHTSDIYLLIRAMNRYLQNQQGATADIFDYLVTKVLSPLALNPVSFESLRTIETDGSRGRAFGGYGMFWTQDNIARMGKFIHPDGGKIDGQQTIDAAMLQAALQQNPADRGLDAGGGLQYNNGFWALEFGPAEGYSCSFRVPFMSGYGGISVALLPGGGVYYIFSDNGEYRWATAVREVDKILGYCS
jgi:hypothetical protein